MLFKHTNFETGATINSDYVALMLLGCGIVLITNQKMIDNCRNLGYKLHNIFGKTVGFSLMSYQL